MIGKYILWNVWQMKTDSTEWLITVEEDHLYRKAVSATERFPLSKMYVKIYLMQVESPLQNIYFYQRKKKSYLCGSNRLYSKFFSHGAIIIQSSPSSAACIIKCKQDSACKTSGINKDRGCYLFGEKGKKQDSGGVTVSLFKCKQISEKNQQ